MRKNNVERVLRGGLLLFLLMAVVFTRSASTEIISHMKDHALYITGEQSDHLFKFRTSFFQIYSRLGIDLIFNQNLKKCTNQPEGHSGSIAPSLQHPPLILKRRKAVHYRYARDTTTITMQRLQRLQKQAYQIGLVALNGEMAQVAELNPLLRKNFWCAQQGKTLKETLCAWGKRAGWVIHWESQYDYPILSPVCFSGSFAQVMEDIANTYQHAERPFYLDLYPKQWVVVVSD